MKSLQYIFYIDYEYKNKHYIDEYPGYEKNCNNWYSELYNYLKKFHGNNKVYRKCPWSIWWMGNSNREVNTRIPSNHNKRIW